MDVLKWRVPAACIQSWWWHEGESERAAALLQNSWLQQGQQQASAAVSGLTSAAGLPSGSQLPSLPTSLYNNFGMPAAPLWTFLACLGMH